MTKHYIDVPYQEKDKAKALGARWDVSAKKWYYTKSIDEEKFSRWLNKPFMNFNDLSEEQQEFIVKAKEGKNILVDACIGSGKTTTIQVLCNEMTNKKILYLTYNTLLKLDAREKIHMKNVTVTNYHGFAFTVLKKKGIAVGKQDLIQTFNKMKPALGSKYNVLILDEYQDIEQEIAEMLLHIKKRNPNLQIIAVGDMEQKIYDKTTLDVPQFIDSFLGDHVKMNFSKCFRLNSELASKLGTVWEKEINGVNSDCEVQHMSFDECIKFLSTQKPSDILCLGARTGLMAKALNELEKKNPEKFNKKSVYASIANEDRQNSKPDSSTAIFTTYDSSKGMERPICVVFDYTLDYWQIRAKQPMTKYEILRNIFCVAASRGKKKIIFVSRKDSIPLSVSTLKNKFETLNNCNKFKAFYISNMFDFKYIEDTEKCFSLLKIKRVSKREEETPIDLPNSDYLIDLSPCIGVYQEAAFFKNYDIDSQLKYTEQAAERTIKLPPNATLEQKILYLTALETAYNRYATQVKIPFISESNGNAVKTRLKTVFDENETVQQEKHFQCDVRNIESKEIGNISIIGRADVLKDNKIFELKFVSELEHKHFLQLACYLFIFKIHKGVLWNVRTNEKYEVTIPDREAFLSAVVKTITKNNYDYAHTTDDSFFTVKKIYKKGKSKEVKNSFPLQTNVLLEVREEVV